MRSPRRKYVYIFVSFIFSYIVIGGGVAIWILDAIAYTSFVADKIHRLDN